MELDKATRIAESIKRCLYPGCTRVEIAGSVRREKPEVHDIEIVCAPIVQCSIFGSGKEEFESCLDILGGHRLKDGDRYKQIALPEGINLDLFIVLAPAQWGVIFTIRTGSAEFSHRLVTQKKYGGYMPAWARVKDGALWQGSEIIPTPEETDFFKAIDLDWIEPKERI